MSLDTVLGSDRSTLATGLAAGVAYLVLVLVVSGAVGAFGNVHVDSQFVLVMAYIAVGMVLLGAVPAVLFLETRLVTPMVVVVGVFGYAALDFATAQNTALGPLAGYLFGWPAVLALAAVSGLLELAAKRAAARLGTVVRSSSGTK